MTTRVGCVCARERAHARVCVCMIRTIRHRPFLPTFAAELDMQQNDSVVVVVVRTARQNQPTKKKSFAHAVCLSVM